MTQSISSAPASSSPKNRDSVSHTLFMALAVSLVCSVLVSTAAVLLKPLQRQNQLFHSGNKNIIQLLETLPLIKDASQAAGQLNIKIVDLENGEYDSSVDASGFDAGKAAKDPALGMDIPEQLDIAGIGRRSRYAAVYLLQDGARIQYIILPIYGAGMWSTIYGYLALQTDANTIAGLSFYEHGETPGIGDRIQDPAWLGQWQGKQVYVNGQPQISVVKRRQLGAEPYQVDAVSGATITSEGVGNMLQYWLGRHGFQTYLDRIRSLE